MKNNNKKTDFEDPDFLYIKSRCSCKVDDIIGITFGGIDSRFWMLRKHFNSMSQKELDLVPFHNWQCITIQTRARDINIVIKDQ